MPRRKWSDERVELHDKYCADPRDDTHRGRVVSELDLLNTRIRLLRNIQLTSCMGFLFNVLTIFAL
jgi:hypothetical protein